MNQNKAKEIKFIIDQVHKICADLTQINLNENKKAGRIMV